MSISSIRGLLKKAKGFTLIELLIVIAIIAILTVAFLPQLTGAQAKARDTARIATIRSIATAIATIGTPPIANPVAGGCLDFTALPATTIFAEISTRPTIQTASGITLCMAANQAGVFYKTFKADGSVTAAGDTVVNYVIVTQLEKAASGNVYGAAITADSDGTNESAAFATYTGTGGNSAVTRLTPSAGAQAFYAARG